MKILGLALAVFALPYACEAAFKLPSSQMPGKVSLPSYTIGTPAARLHAPAMLPKGVSLPANPAAIPTGPARLPSVIHPLPVGPVAMGLLANSQPAEPQSQPANSEKLDRVFDNTRKKTPEPARRRERGYYPLPESDLLEEIGVR